MTRTIPIIAIALGLTATTALNEYPIARALAQQDRGPGPIGSGDLVLDSRRDDVLAPGETGYRWLYVEHLWAGGVWGWRRWE